MKAQKKIHRFLLASLPIGGINDTVAIDDERVCHQVHRVLKIQAGETIIVFANGGPNIIAEVVETAPHLLTVSIKSVEEAKALPRSLIAAISIVKGDHFELMVQKLTEIGVTTIVPLITARTIKQAVRIERLQTISDEALEQCGGTIRVHITESMSLTACFEQYPHQSVILDPLATATTVELVPGPAVFYVGPEGGWNEQDEAIISFYNPQYLQITQRVLRTETATILAAYNLLWHY